MRTTASDWLGPLIEECDAVLVRIRMRETGESEEACKAVVADVRSRTVMSQQQRLDRRRKYMREYMRNLEFKRKASVA